MAFSRMAGTTETCMQCTQEVSISIAGASCVGGASWMCKRGCSAYHGSSLMKPSKLHICTSATHTKHWKNSNAIGAWKSKLLSVALLSNTMLAEAAHRRRVLVGMPQQMEPSCRSLPAYRKVDIWVNVTSNIRSHFQPLTCTVR